jgi:predicted transport protein
VLASVEDRLTRHNKLRLYVEVKSLDKVSPKALLDDLKAVGKHWNRFDRKAIVTDISALGTAAEWVGKIMPGIDVQVFSFNERESARQWIIS